MLNNELCSRCALAAGQPMSYILPEKPAERFLTVHGKTGQVLKKDQELFTRVGIVDMGTYMPVGEGKEEREKEWNLKKHPC